MDPKPRPLYFEIFCAALAAILLEIAYTRIFSFKVFYYFTYLILGLGLLGIGAGGVLVATSRALRALPVERLLPALALAGGAAVLGGYLLIAPLRLDVSRVVSDPREIGELVLASLLLMVPFLSVGIIVSTILGSRPDRAGRLYGADLIGASLACVLCIPLMDALDPPRTVVLAGVLLAASGLRLAWRLPRLRITAIAGAFAIATPVAVPRLLIDPAVDAGKGYESFRERGSVRFSAWSPVFRIDVSDFAGGSGDHLLVHHDGLPGSGLHRFDGDASSWGHLQTDPRALPFEVIGPGPRVLIIGAAGGHEIQASLVLGASHVTAVELNPVTVSLLTHRFADLTGRLAERDDVVLLNGDGRWYLKQTDERFDLIWFVAPDSYAAMNASTSGAFVLSESYLYTREMLQESLRHLADGGIICAQFGEMDYARRPNRTTRYLTTAREAYAVEGIDDFASHVLVSSTAGFQSLLESVVVLGRDAFSDDRIRRFVGKTRQIRGGIVRWAPGRRPDHSPVNRAIALPDAELEAWLERHPYRVGPVRDDSPFFWHFARFADALDAPLPGGQIIDHEDSIAEQVTIVFLLVVVALAAIFLLAPFLRVRENLSDLPYRLESLVYFAALGLGFMFIEVALIQKLTLFLGYPTHSLTVTLFAILLFSGLGSLASGRYQRDPGRSLWLLFAALCAVTAGLQAALPALVDHFVGSARPVRIALAVVAVAPVGLCLGAFMPIGLRSVAAVSARPREYVAWAWAVNGFFSVIASILATILAMGMGFRAVMLGALAIYGVGILCMARIVRRLPRAAS